MTNLTSQSAEEMVRNIFSPMVSVITSPLVDEMCHKNNLGFVEMLQPFSSLKTEGKHIAALNSIFA